MAESREQMLERMERVRAARRISQRGEALTEQQRLDMQSSDVIEIESPADVALEEHCAAALDFVASLDPGWKERIRVVREIRGFTARQTLGAFAGYVLDRSLHLEIPAHPFFDPSNQPMRLKKCELRTCNVMFRQEVPGQRFCSNFCGFSYQKEPAANAAPTR